MLLAVVAAIAAWTHWPALDAQALTFDDDQYLTNNALVQRPSWTSARRFMTEVLEPSTVGGYYQPLTMVSLMLDYAGGGREENLHAFHRKSLLLRVANTLLIVLLLYAVFGNSWVAAAVGLLFGAHPMTVEPIPWVGERKTLLAAFFSLASLLLYVRYARQPRPSRLVAPLLCFVPALLSKPTSTPLPALMLIMDFWPLRRLSLRAAFEKVPFFAVAGVSALVTYVSQSRTSVTSLPGEYPAWHVPLTLAHNIVFYLRKMLWPTDLTSHYPYPDPFTLEHPAVLAGVIGTGLLLASLVVALRWTRAPLSGWSMFFVQILPTMGIIGFTNVIASDKFAYLPAVGVLLVLAALLCWISAPGRPRSRARLVSVGALIVVVVAFECRATRAYLGHWRDSDSLSLHMLALAPDSGALHNRNRDRTEEAIEAYREALRLEPYSRTT